MSNGTSPTVPRWQLGSELRRGREKHGLTWKQVADKMQCSPSKIRRIEMGENSISAIELDFLLDLYGVKAKQVRATLQELQARGRQRGWWAKFGGLPRPFTDFLGMETAATTIRMFELAVVPGLLQTADYARAISSGAGPDMTAEQLEQWAELRLARQSQVFGDEPARVSAILDESVIRRVVGGPDVQKAQLRKLLDVADICAVQVVPFSQGGYPGTRGTFQVLEFGEVHSPVVYVEDQAGNLYLEEEDEVARCNIVWGQMRAVALPANKSADLISAAVKEL